MTSKTEVSSNQGAVPLAVTVARASDLSGYGLTMIWAFLKDGRLEKVQVPGVRRTLVSYASLVRLLSPPELPAPTARKRGRPRKDASASLAAAPA